MVLLLVLEGQVHVLVLGGQVLVLVLVLGVRSLSWSLGVRSLITSLPKCNTFIILHVPMESLMTTYTVQELFGFNQRNHGSI